MNEIIQHALERGLRRYSDSVTKALDSEPFNARPFSPIEDTGPILVRGHADFIPNPPQTIPIVHAPQIERELMTTIQDAHGLLSRRRKEAGQLVACDAEQILWKAIQKYGGGDF